MMMSGKGTCCCILHLLHRVGSTNLFVYRNVILKVDNTCVRNEGPRASKATFPCLLLLHFCNRPVSGKHFFMTLSLSLSEMREMVSSLLSLRGNVKLEMEEEEKKMQRESKEKA